MIHMVFVIFFLDNHVIIHVIIHVISHVIIMYNFQEKSFRKTLNNTLVYDEKNFSSVKYRKPRNTTVILQKRGNPHK